MTNTDNLTFPATAMPDRDWWQALWPDPAEVLAKLGFKPGMVAVDLCCGDGLFTTPMSRMLGGQVYAVDLDPTMLVQAQAAIKNAGVPDCDWLEADAREMVDIIPRKVDIVLIANTFHGVPEQVEMAKNARAVLKPEGRFIVVNWHVAPREETKVLGQPRGPRLELRMAPSAVEQVAAQAGLLLETVVELPPYHYGAIFRNPE